MTARDAPMSAATAIHSVAQPPTASTMTTALMAIEKAMFCLMIPNALRLNRSHGEFREVVGHERDGGLRPARGAGGPPRSPGGRDSGRSIAVGRGTLANQLTGSYRGINSPLVRHRSGRPYSIHLRNVARLYWIMVKSLR